MTQKMTNVPYFIAAAVIPPVIATATVYYGAVVVPQYGWVMFLSIPTIMGFATGTIYSVGRNTPFWQNFLAGMASIVVTGLFITMYAIEGLVCLVMALPLALPLNTIGVLIGWTAAKQLTDRRTGAGLSMLLFLCLPFLMGFEVSNKSTPTVHKVVSTVEIDVPIGVVWQNVIAFPQIDKEPEGILNLGFAYPINAKIDGTGVGAIRYCNFNTGPFVEPITEWQEPYLLAFDVKEQPAPMIETSPWGEIHVAHLDYLKSQKGQFRLYEKYGKTVVEGTTFYTHDIAPDIYWKLYSDEIIHQIHMRVLNHIKEVSEN